MSNGFSARKRLAAWSLAKMVICVNAIGVLGVAIFLSARFVDEVAIKAIVLFIAMIVSGVALFILFVWVFASDTTKAGQDR